MAAGVSLNKNISSVWQKILTVVNNALVFMDNPAAEMLHWSGKVKNVFEAGALAVYDLSSRRSGNESETKAVFIVTSVIDGQILDDISAIVQSSDFQHCTILCTVPEYVNAFAKHTNAMEVSVFGELSLKLREWMGNPYSTVDIHHVPLFASQICPGLFFTPSFSTFFPIMPSDIARLQGFLRSTGDKGKLFNSLSDIDMSDLPHNLQVKIKMFAASLSSMFELMDINEDCYGMGYLSKLIANELANLPAARGRRKTANGRASLVLIDRTLDLAGPCSHSGDTIADKIIALLPRLPYHQVDVAVDMSSVCARGSVTPDTVAPGCLSHANDKVSQVLLNSLFTKKQKEGLVDLSRSLTHALNKESLDISSQPTKVTLETIQAALDHFRGQPKAFQNNSPLLQITMAAISALRHKDISHFQRLLGKEKGLFLSLGEDDPQSIINDLISCLESDKNKEFSCIEDILLVLCYLYSLVGDIFMESPAELERLKNVMVDCLLSGKLTCRNKEFLDDEIVEKTARRKVADAFEKLLGIGQARDEMKQFQNVYQDATALKEAFYQPLIKQALDAIFDKDKPELVDIEFKSHGLKDYIKTGFSLFMNVSKPRPSDLPLLVVFVIGGISSTEIKQIRDALATYRTNTQVLIGSTQVIKPADVFQKVFCQDNLFPSLV